jgi:hypothetical protein
MSETESFYSRIISFITSLGLEELRKNIRKDLEELRKQVREEIKNYTRLMAISFVGLVFVTLGMLHLSLGIVKQLTVYVGEALAFSLFGLFSILLGIVMVLLAMLLLKSE